MTESSVSIKLHYDSDFRKSVVERNRPDPLTGMKIQAGNKYIFGDENHVNSSYMSTNLTVQLEAVKKILADKEIIIEFTNGPMWLVVEPHDEKTVKIMECATFESAHDPDQRFSTEKSALVLKTAWISELIETAEEFYQKVVSLNPDLKNDQIRFGFTKKGSISSAFTPQTYGYMPIFELVTVHFPKRMSKYKSGNESFAVLYSVGLIYLINIEPSSIVDYFYQKYKEIEIPYNAKQYAVKGIHELVSIEDEVENKRTFKAGTLLNKLNENIKKEKEQHDHTTFIHITQSGRY